MDRLLITQSLLSAWIYTFDCAEGLEGDAMASFFKTLSREPTPTTKAMQNGIDFENAVYSSISGVFDVGVKSTWEKGVKAVASHIQGAQTQVRVYKAFEVDGQEFLLYGILDALKAGHIYDVKYLNKSFGSCDVLNKYLNSPQHPAYLFAVPEAIDFTYLVSDGSELYTETYTRDMTRNFPDMVADFMKWLKQAELFDLYCRKWKAR